VTVGDLPPDARRTFDVAVEASGSPGGLQTALGLLRPLGTLVLKSTFHGATELDAAPVVVDELSIVGSRCGRFPPALALLARDAVEVESLIHDEFPLADALRAMRRAAEPGVLKVLLRQRT
jgi:threonine dehydrogenase-like Zn-dependent dehydrogenase